MRTLVSNPHHEYPPQVRETVEEKLQHLSRFHRRMMSVRALLERQHEEHRVEIVATVGGGAVLVADAREDAFGSALDEALQRMERLLKRHNEKRHEARRRAPRA